MKTCRQTKRVARGALAAFLVASLFGCGEGGRAPAGAALSSDRACEDAWAMFRNAEYGIAQARFKKIAAEASCPNARARARYFEALTMGVRPDADKKAAAKLFESVVADSPTGEWAAWSLLALARLKQQVAPGETPDYPAVRAACQRVIDAFPGSPVADEAFIHQQATYLAELSRSELLTARENLTRFVDRRSDSPFRTAALDLLRICYQQLGERELELATLLRAARLRDARPDENRGRDAATFYWTVATVAEFEVGDFAVAREFYRRFRDEFPKDNRCYGAKLALARMDALEARLKAEIAAGGKP